MLFRGEMSERIRRARTVTERKENCALREKGVRGYGVTQVLGCRLFNYTYFFT